jgi:hypothetical protein
MQALTKALVTKLKTVNTLNTAVSGRFYNSYAPDKEVFPYCIFRVISEVPDVYFDNSTVETCIVQFDIYSQNISSAEVYNIYDYMCALLDECTLSVTGYTHIRMMRELSELVFDSADTVWQYIVRYRIEIYK